MRHHLLDATTYQQLSPAEADAAHRELRSKVRVWFDKYPRSIGDDALKYIRLQWNNNKEPFGYFYQMYKIHKNPISTRPVCSDCTSLLHPVGQWITTKLQPIAQKMPSYFKNSVALKEMLDSFDVPPNTDIFSCDAESMYTNIPTDAAMAELRQYLEENRDSFEIAKNPQVLLEALELVMNNNIIQFGDTFWKQICGTAMGISPAPPWAIIFFAIHELRFVPQWVAHLIFWKRFIDDGIGLWLRHPNPTENSRLWNEFVSVVNDYHGLKWKFTKPGKSVDFMDMTLTIVGNRITTTLYEKPLNLYLYIPPHSAHAPGISTGLIFGGVLRIYQLCSCPNDAKQRLRIFYRRVLRRGYTPDTLIPLFVKASANALEYLSRSKDEAKACRRAKENAARRSVYFHIPFHPDNPRSSIIQRHWREQVMQPAGKTSFDKLHNCEDEPIRLNRLVVCYSRAPNLGSQFSVRKFQKTPGAPVSSFLT